MTVKTIQCDTMLVSWSETSSGGAKIVLQLADVDQLGPFKSMTLAKGKRAGQLLAAVFVEVDGNGEPLAAAPLEEASPAKRGRGKFPDGLCGLAVRWCEDLDFAEWLEHTFPGAAQEALAGCVGHADFAARVVKRVCMIESRKVLNQDGRGAQLFNERIRGPYAAHRREVGLE